MSTFVIDEQTLNRAVNGIAYVRDSRDFAGLPVTKPRTYTHIGRRLMKMNVAAVSQRYPSDGPNGRPGWYPDGKLWTGEDYVFQPVLGRAAGRRPFQCDVLKGLECLSYQCAEGNVPETWPEYAALADVISDLQSKIVAGLDEYQQAAWG